MYFCTGFYIFSVSSSSNSLFEQSRVNQFLVIDNKKYPILSMSSELKVAQLPRLS